VRCWCRLAGWGKNLEPESVPLIHFSCQLFVVLFVIADVWASSSATPFSGERPSTFFREVFSAIYCCIATPFTPLFFGDSRFSKR
jgi:hypothetical protein